ncbi:MAG: hypothetical protein PHQ40_11810 [Anaerolineaceae bacterium]|nr:hypothetical protein [Anaerolineaceae bacterium]
MFLESGVLWFIFEPYFGFQVALYPPDVGYGSGTDQQTSHPELASYGELTGRERMFDTPYGGFDGRPQVAAFLWLSLTAPSAVSRLRLRLGKTQMMTGVALAG